MPKPKVTGGKLSVNKHSSRPWTFFTLHGTFNPSPRVGEVDILVSCAHDDWEAQVVSVPDDSHVVCKTRPPQPHPAVRTVDGGTETIDVTITNGSGLDSTEIDVEYVEEDPTP